MKGMTSCFWNDLATTGAMHIDVYSSNAFCPCINAFHVQRGHLSE